MDLLVQVSEVGADDQRLARLAGYLRSELLQASALDVRSITVGELPPDARGTEVSVVGGLLVVVGQAADSLRSLVLAVKGWAARGSDTGRVVHLEIGGDKLKLSQATAAEQERLVELFIARHSLGGNGKWPDSAKP